MDILDPDHNNSISGDSSHTTDNSPKRLTPSQATINNRYNNYKEDLDELGNKYYYINVIKFAYLKPTSYKQAVNSPEKEDWLKAMSSEIQKLENQNTWSLVELPKNRTALGGRWVYKKKPNKFKTR